MAKLVPKVIGNKLNLDAQMLALPEVIELLIFNTENNKIQCDCSGFYLDHEDFCGDIYQYKPGVPRANIITFGPPGSGKSSFVNSVCSALSDYISLLNVDGSGREVVTSGLLQFHLYLIPEFEDLNFSLYDVPGVDGKNYKGDEIALLMHGLLSPEVDFKYNRVTFSTIANHRDDEETERRRRPHVVAFLVPQGAYCDTELMERLSELYRKITIEHKRSPVVVISHADEIDGEEYRAEVLESVCKYLAVHASKVYFLENYVDTKVKDFHIDKAVLRILLALLQSADDFLKSEHDANTLKIETKNESSDLEQQPVTPVSANGSGKPLVVDYLMQQAHQLETSGSLSLAKKYYAVALNETVSTSKLHKQARKSIASIKEHQMSTRKREAEENAKRLQESIQAIQSEIAKQQDQAQHFAQIKDEFEKERAQFEHRVRAIEEQVQKVKEQETKFREWEAKMQAQQPEMKNHEFLVSAHKASDQVAQDRLDYNEKVVKAEDAREKLAKSEKDLQEKEERLQVYIGMVEQLKGGQHFNELLHAVREHINKFHKSTIKCFISYAWQPQENAKLQAKLVKLKEDLERTGIEVMLDIHNMEGDIEKYMADGIQSSNFVILICTPRFKQRAEEKSATPNNLQKEYRAALLRQSQNSKFIIPLMLEGDHTSSITQEISNILWTDFVDPANYFKSMVNLEPKGLIPKILGLEGDKSYEFMVKGFHCLLAHQKM